MSAPASRPVMHHSDDSNDSDREPGAFFMKDPSKQQMSKTIIPSLIVHHSDAKSLFYVFL